MMILEFESTFDNVKLPSKSVIIPLVVPATRILAPIIGSPFESTANYYPETYSNMIMCGTVAIASKRRCQSTPCLSRYATGKIFS